MKHMDFVLIDESEDGRAKSYQSVEVEVPEESIVHGNPRAYVEVNRDEVAGYSVWFDWSAVVKVDRPVTFGISVGSGRKALDLAARIIKATEAGAVFADAHVWTDMDGRTYVADRCLIRGRTLNADLRRLGF